MKKGQHPYVNKIILVNNRGNLYINRSSLNITYFTNNYRKLNEFFKPVNNKLNAAVINVSYLEQNE
jgi:hypothetical protein